MKDRQDLFFGGLQPSRPEAVDFPLGHRKDFCADGISLLELADDIDSRTPVFTGQFAAQGSFAAAVLCGHRSVKAQVGQIRAVPYRIRSVPALHLREDVPAERRTVFKVDLLHRLTVHDKAEGEDLAFFRERHDRVEHGEEDRLRFAVYAEFVESGKARRHKIVFLVFPFGAAGNRAGELRPSFNLNQCIACRSHARLIVLPGGCVTISEDSADVFGSVQSAAGYTALYRAVAEPDNTAGIGSVFQSG